MKISDGNDSKAAFCALEALRQLGYATDEAFWESLRAAHPEAIYNDNDTLIGRQESVFKINRPE